MRARPAALLLALALPASAQVRLVVPSGAPASPAVRLAPPPAAPSPSLPSLAPSLASSLALPEPPPPAFAEGRALFDGAALAAPAPAAEAPASPRGTSIRFNDVELPSRVFTDQGRPSESLIAAIDATRETLELALHGLALRELAEALRRAKARGVRVRIVMNRSHVFPERERDRREAEVQLLLDEGFELRVLRGGDQHGAMHNKFAVFDGRLLETGSYNWTAAADRKHFENVLFLDEARRVRAYGAHWRWLWERSSAVDDPAGVPAGELAPAPAPSGRVDFNGVGLPAEAFSPLSAEASIIAAVDAARSTLDLAAFSFTSAALRDALLRARSRGVRVRVVFDANQFRHLREMRELVARGFDVRLSNGRDGQRGAQHNKFSVLDGRLVQTGSYNWTTNAHKNNFENVLFLGAPDDAAAYAAYFERIWEQSADPDQLDMESPLFAPEGAVPSPGSPW